ncbi:MFS transporter [Caballeronia novacaledonica]|uniref:MFS transporter n=1 Tax=Caballeronia novacaledonica TaxID=1544861 RepID=A0AA37MUE8_9BURK|nr:MFS transporter [Caballeronia novacaledonica]GJH28979.1 MFS transporter [Caballeronia novacaledonica]
MEQRAIFAKIAWRVMPVLFLVFVLAYMDRVNIGFAKLQFSRELRLTDTMYGQAAGIFFFGYMLSGIPSNLLLAKVGARATICGIMVTWGSVSSMMMLVSTPAQLYLLRFLLGLAEGGLAPGVYLYLTYWFPATMRARMLAVFLAAVPVAGIVCAPLSGYVLATMHDMYGLRGWQWMFLLEGVPSIVAGIAVYFVLQDSPQTANWLTAKEKQWIGSMLASDMRASSLSQYRSNVSEALTSRTFLTLAIVETIGGAAVSGFAYWLPQIVHDLGVRSLSHNGLITAIPSVCAGIGMVIWSYSSDRFRERKWHYASAAAASAIALLVAGRSGGDFYVAIAALSLAYTGILSCVSVFWAYATTYLRSDAAVVGIGVLNSVAASAGYLTQYGLGALSMATHNSLSGLYFIAIAMLAGGSLMLILPGNGGPLQTSTTVRSALLRRPFRRSSDGD